MYAFWNGASSSMRGAVWLLLVIPRLLGAWLWGSIHSPTPLVTNLTAGSEPDETRDNIFCPLRSRSTVLLRAVNTRCSTNKIMGRTNRLISVYILWVRTALRNVAKYLPDQTASLPRRPDCTSFIIVQFIGCLPRRCRQWLNSPVLTCTSDSALSVDTGREVISRNRCKVGETVNRSQMDIDVFGQSKNCGARETAVAR
jgi:hypothetical protein